MRGIARPVLGMLTAPGAMATLVAVAAVAVRALGRRRLARGLLMTAAAIAYLSATGMVGGALLAPLERQYPPLEDGAPLPAVDRVVVLGSGYTPRDGEPVTAALSADGLVRIVEGIRLVRMIPGARLVVSGGPTTEHPAPALGYAALALQLGVSDSDLVVLDRGEDTHQEAISIAAQLGGTPFLLVTSPYHMPRAMRMLRRVGARPIAAPAGPYSEPLGRGRWRLWLPNSHGLQEVELALHEYAGLTAMAMGLD